MLLHRTMLSRAIAPFLVWATALPLVGAAFGVFVGCAPRHSPDEPTHLANDKVPFVPPEPYPDIIWTSSLDEARVRAADEHKPLIIFIRAAWSRPSVVMDTTIWHDNRVLAEAGRFIAARVDLTSNYGAPIPDSLRETYDIKDKDVPTTLIISSEGKILGRFLPGKARPAEIAAAMKDAK